MMEAFVNAGYFKVEYFGILFCIVLSGIFSGLNIGLFGLARLRLESEAGAGNILAQDVMKMREDSNFLLTTLLWGNVSVNTMLALLTESVMSGVQAFVFTTFIITFLGEILPQAWFSRNALKVGSKLRPLVKLFQFILYPLAKPSAIILDKWLGKEGLHFFSEETLNILLEKHILDSDTDIERFEGIGALNFLNMDDLTVDQEGEIINSESILSLKSNLDLPIIPEVSSPEFQNFIDKVIKCPVKWMILLGSENDPLLILNTDAYIKSYYSKKLTNSYQHCHRPIIFTNSQSKLSEIAYNFRVDSKHAEDDVIDQDVVLLWTEEKKKIITGTDILGRLFRGIVDTRPAKTP